MTSIERTAYPRFKRLLTAHELHLFFTPSRDEVEWAAARADCDEHLLAQLLTLKSYQRMGCFPKLEEIPETVVDFVRRAVDLPEGTVAKAANRTAERQWNAVRRRTGLSYDKAKARKIAEIVRRLQEEGHAVDPEDLAHISPYLTEHVRRFGEYSTHELGLVPEAHDPHLDVDFSPLRGDAPPAPDGYGQAA